MPWFKVDDGLHAHKKAVKAGVEAMGLWVLAGSWSADLLTDGFVPDYIAARIDPNYKKNAARLVAARLWVPDEHDGDSGWRFHDWKTKQPSSESVLEEREAARTRMQRVRANKKAGSADVRPNTERTSPEVRVTPTRPDPTITTNGPSAANGRNARKPDEPPPTAPVDTGIAQKLVEGWLGMLATKPQQRIVDQVAGHVIDALRDDQSPEHVAEALRIWHRRGNLGPAMIPQFIHHLANPGQPGADIVHLRDRASPRPSTTDAAVAVGVDMINKYRALDAQEGAR
jgi:hypothetical protein